MLTEEHFGEYHISMETCLTNTSRIIDTIRIENPVTTSFLCDSTLDDITLVEQLKKQYSGIMENEHPNAWSYYTGMDRDDNAFFRLTWRDFAFIRIMDYLDHEGETFTDGNLHGETVVSHPVVLLRKALRGEKCEATDEFFLDFLHLLRQINGTERPELPSRQTVQNWMERYPSGLDKTIIARRAANKERIVGLLVRRILDESALTSPRQRSIYRFAPNITVVNARKQVLRWWRDDRFHLRYAIRSTDELNRYLDGSLDEKTLQVMHDAEKQGIPRVCDSVFSYLGGCASLFGSWFPA